MPINLGVKGKVRSMASALPNSNRKPPELAVCKLALLRCATPVEASFAPIIVERTKT